MQTKSYFQVLIIAFGLFACQGPVEKSPEEEPIQIDLLEAYVQSESPDFSYEIVHSVPGEEMDFHVLKMYSQKWLSDSLVDETPWWHWVSILVPKNTTHQTGMLWIGGGSRETEMPQEPDALLKAAASQTNSIVAQIHNVPFNL